MKGTFDDLADLKRWVPYKLVYNPNREKFDKVPHNGRHGLSTKDSTDWLTFPNAWEASSGYGLSGVGIVLTGGIELAGWTLVGLDFDQVDFDSFTPPFKTYTELSPSKIGVRSFVWVPTPWAHGLADTTVSYPGCDHLEIYIGTAARFLTVTFEVIDDLPIAHLQGLDLEKLTLQAVEDRPVDPVDLPGDAGRVINLKRHDLSPEQKHLVDGTGNIDRSQTLHGLIIKLVDARETPADILATVLKIDALWAYCLSHRRDEPDRALEFARNEVARAYAKSKTGMMEKLSGFNHEWEAPKQVVNDEALTFPISLYERAPGLVGDIARWIYKASYTPRAEFAYAAALSMAACLIGPYCTSGPKQGKVNLYLVLVGGTGTGKNEAIDPMGALLSQTDAKDCLSDFPASEAALRRQLNGSPNMLIKMDELAPKLDSMKDSSNGSLMGKAILEMYNGARLPPKAYADERKSLPAVENPFVQILGGTTNKVWDVVKTGHMEDGTLNRFIFVSLPDAPEYSRNHKPDCTITKEFKDKLNAFYRTGAMCDLIGFAPPGFGRNVQYSKDVEEALAALDLELWPKMQKKFGALYSRFTHNMMKIATILAVCSGRLVVLMEDFKQAYDFMNWSVNNTCYKASMHMADTEFAKTGKRVINLLMKNGGRVRMRDVYRQLNMASHIVESVLNVLQISERVELVKQENRNKTETVWVRLLDDSDLENEDEIEGVEDYDEE